MRDHPHRSHGTTTLSVRHRGKIVVAGDGQVSLGATVVKHGARKIRRFYSGEVLAGFAGSTADAMALLTKFEAKIEEHRGNLERAAVELSKEWRSDRAVRRLEAALVVATRESAVLLSGAGEVIAPDDGILAIGSGGPFALAAARALLRRTELDAEAIARESLKIASEICVYTNEQISVEVL